MKSLVALGCSGVATGRGLGERVPPLVPRTDCGIRPDPTCEVGKTGGGYHSVSLDNFGIIGRYNGYITVSTNYHRGRAPPQIPPPNGSDLNYFQFTPCHAKL